MKSVAADSGPLLALFNRSETWNARVLAWVEANPDARLFTTWPVVTEVCALLSKRVSEAAALNFLLWIERGGLVLDTPGPHRFTTHRRSRKNTATCRSTLPTPQWPNWQRGAV